MFKLYVVIAVLLIAFLLGKYLSVFEHEVNTNWYALVQRGVNDQYYYDTELSSIRLNGKILQNTTECDTCPLALNFSPSYPYVYSIKSKKNLSNRNIDKLEIVFKHNSFLRSFFLPRPKITYKIQLGCEVVTQILFEQVDNQIKQSRTIASKKNIDLNEIFSKLIRDSLNTWVSTLDTISLTSKKQSGCIRLIKAIRYLNTGNASGFKSRAFTLKPEDLEPDQGIIAYINTVDLLIRPFLQNNKDGKLNLSIYITGYADSTKFVNPIPLTGSEPILMSIDWCNTNSNQANTFASLKDISKVLSIIKRTNQERSGNFTVLEGQIAPNDNCQLSAMRAYYVAREFENRFDNLSNNVTINYFYKAGGISDDRILAKNRKISIELKLDQVTRSN